MTTFIVPLVLVGGLTSVGVYLLLERGLTRMLLGALAHRQRGQPVDPDGRRPSGNPPVHGRTSDGETTTADPLAQGMILTAIVISMGIAAFVLSLIYRTYRLTTDEEVVNDPEDTRGVSADRRGARSPRRSPARSAGDPRHQPSPDEAGCAAGAGGIAVSASAVLTPLPVLTPLLGAAATMFAGRRPRLQRGITLAALTAVVAVCAAAALPRRSRRHDRPARRRLGKSVAGMGPLGVTLVVDRLSR
jgi:multicomponent Na+:H+ antiporter subunit C